MTPADMGQENVVSRQPQEKDKGTNLLTQLLHEGYLHKLNLVLASEK